jgi:hypothetical protein
MVVACGHGEATEGDRAAARLSERSFSIAADTLWRIGATAGESTFVEPWHLAAGGGAVYVVDAGRGLLAFDAGGRRRGASLADVAQPALLGPVTVLGDGTIMVVRRDDGALLAFDSSGRRMDGAPRVGVQDAQGLCAIDETTLLISGGQDRLTRIDRGGGPPVPFPFPWVALRDSAGLLRQTVLASEAGSPGCVVALLVGTGFAIVRSADSATFHAYIEAIDVPPVRRVVETAGDRITTTTTFERRVIAAASVAAGDASIYIAFGGETPRRIGLIDVYDRATGAYRGSLTIGAPVRAIAASGGILYVLSLDSGVPALAAFRPRMP